MFMNENFILQNDTTNLLVPQWLPTECLVPDSVHDIGAGSTLSGVDNSSIQQVLEKLEEISTLGIGFSDVISVIAIPLIIMLFAFAFPFIFDSINHINSKYESKELSRLFEQNKRYIFFWGTTYFSLAYIILFGVLYLLLPSAYVKEYSNVASWTSLIVALLYSECIVLFVRYCIRFNKAESLIGLIESTYKVEQKKVKPSLWKRLKIASKEWRHRKDKDWLKVYKQARNFSGIWGDASPDSRYNQRLIALCKYALKQHDITLFYQVLDGENKIIEKEKHSEREIIGTKVGLKEGAIHYLSSDFFQEIFEFYATCQRDKQVEETLLWRCLGSYNKSQFISFADVFFLAKTLRLLCDKNLTLLLEKYIDRSAYYFSYVPRLPRILYVKGQPANERASAEKESRENWDELCNYHYLVMAYAYSKGMHTLLNGLLINKSFRAHSLYPVSSEDILIRYARCASKIKETGYFDHMKADELFDTTINLEEIIQQYTAALMLLFGEKENLQTEEVTADDITLLIERKGTLIGKAKQVQADNRLCTLFADIKNTNADKLIGEAIEKLKQSIDPSAYVKAGEKDAPEIKTERWTSIFWPFDVVLHFMEKKKEPEKKNWYKEPVDQSIKEQFESYFNNYRHDIGLHLPGTFFVESEQSKSKALEVGECQLLINKICFLADVFDIHSLYRDYLELLSNRMAYMMLKAYDNMKKVEVELTPAEFGHFVEGYTNGGKEDYLIVDVDSHMSAWMDTEFRAGFSRYYKNMPMLSMESVGRFGLLTDLPAYESFKEKLILIPKNNQPTLKKKSGEDSVNFTYKDESSEEKKELALRVGVDLGLQMTYNPDDSIVVVKIKKMSV